MDIENKVVQWIETNSSFLSKRAKRFLAMYFPNSAVRRKFWQETGVVLGENTYLNLNVSVIDDYRNNETLLEIGRNCSIAPGVVFAPISAHNNSVILRETGILKRFEKRGKIIISDDVWIGANSTILAGVTIGRCSIIGANSLVNKDIPEFSLAYGSPVRLVENIKESIEEKG